MQGDTGKGCVIKIHILNFRDMSGYKVITAKV